MRLARGLIVGVASLAFAASAGAATITVTTTADQYGTGAACSIREAVEAANTNAAFGGCHTGAGPDTVRIPAGTFTITIPPAAGTDPNPNSEGDFVVTSSIMFVGAGQTATRIDGGGLDRLFYVNGDIGVVFSKLTLRHGDPVPPNQNGGAIYSSAPVALRNVRLVDNDARSGGGIHVADPGFLIVTGSTVSGNSAGGDLSSNGGGISTLNAGLSVRDTIIRGNDSASSGGGIYTEGGGVALTRVVVDWNESGFGGGLYAGKSDTGPSPRLTISQSTFTKNSAQVSGGGINVNEDTSPVLVGTIDRTLIAKNHSGGYVPATPFTGVSDGVHNQAILTITNSTVTGNGDSLHEGKGGGLLNTQFGTMNLRNVTVTGNRASDVEGDGDNLYNDGLLRMRNSIVGGATATGSCGGAVPLVSQGHNLEFTTGGNRCVSTGTDRLGNPRLKPLAANGGPTKTLALGPNSAALNRGAVCASTDQRGAPRSLGGRCDLGAYERVRCRGAIVNVVGTSGRDIFRLGSRMDAVLGLGGNDTINGGGGGDRLCGGAGNDRLAGGGGADILDGGPGGDTCIGGPGSDRAYSCRTARQIP
jgi:CSLREA domain-containing protein